MLFNHPAKPKIRGGVHGVCLMHVRDEMPDKKRPVSDNRGEIRRGAQGRGAIGGQGNRRACEELFLCRKKRGIAGLLGKQEDSAPR